MLTIGLMGEFIGFDGRQFSSQAKQSAFKTVEIADTVTSHPAYRLGTKVLAVASGVRSVAPDILSRNITGLKSGVIEDITSMDLSDWKGVVIQATLGIAAGLIAKKGLTALRERFPTNEARLLKGNLENNVRHV